MSPKDQNDPIIDEIREIRSRISAEFGDDPKKLIDHYIKLQKQHAERLIEIRTGPENEDEDAA
jgi:hypothetical protein